MIYLLTGTPGHGKTQRALWMLLNDQRFKGRTVLYANVRGLKTDDERLKNWLPLTDVTQWETAPQGSVIFIDECHQAGFFPVRGVGKPPPWIEAIATHRHLGIDFVLVTQNAKNMDVFVRRMVELHIHCKRPAQMGYSNVYEFQSFTDCDDRIPTDQALRHSRWVFDKSIWTLYESADEHTGKPKIPRFVYAVPLLLIVAGVIAYYLYEWAAKKTGAKPPVASVTALASAATPGAGMLDKNRKVEAVSLSRLSPQARTESIMHDARDFGFERVPLHPDFPESAPIYEELRVVKAMPIVSGCAAKGSDCRCVDQQGTPARVTLAACLDFVVNGRFDPYREQSKSKEIGERSPATSAVSSGRYCVTSTIYGLGGSSSLETRCEERSGSQLATNAAVGALPQLAGAMGQVGQPSGSALGVGSTVPDIQRGGYVTATQQPRR